MRQRQRDRETETERQRQTEAQRETQRQTERDRDRQTERETVRDREAESQGEVFVCVYACMHVPACVYAFACVFVCVCGIVQKGEGRQEAEGGWRGVEGEGTSINPQSTADLGMSMVPPAQTMLSRSRERSPSAQVPTTLYSCSRVRRFLW